MAREYQNGDGFGYVLALRKKDTSSWTVVRIPHVESSRYVYYNNSLTPYSPFEVRIKAYNRRGEGPFSQIAVVHSAEEGESLWRKQIINAKIRRLLGCLYKTERKHITAQTEGQQTT